MESLAEKHREEERRERLLATSNSKSTAGDSRVKLDRDCLDFARCHCKYVGLYVRS